MIESIAVIAVGIFLIWLSRKSRNLNQRIDKMSPKAKKDLIDIVKRDHRRHYLVGGSVTNIPNWIVMLVIIIFAVAFWAGISSVT
jgi:type VI protein secretion system component VasF